MIKYRLIQINYININLLSPSLWNENSNNRILHYKPGVKSSTLRISLQRYNDTLEVLLEISAALCGVPCLMEYSFREN